MAAWKLGSVVMAATAATMLLGCAVHLPKTNQVAFDYSDHTYYDRGYAPSPSAHLSASAVENYTPRADAQKDAAVDSAVAAGRLDAVRSDDERVANH